MTVWVFDARPAALRVGGAACILGLVVCGLSTACKGNLEASAKGSAKADADGKGEASFEADGDSAWDTVDASQSEDETSANATLTAPQGASTSSEVALLGARHDLRVAPGAPAPCACLAVVIGEPSSAQMVWAGRRPTIDPSSQTVIALSSDGVPCTEAGPGASYMGYVKKDGDVIVTVEAAVAGRPVTHGAIIPKPDAGKRIYVVPDGKIPYGRGKGGEPRCAVGSPR